VCVPVISIRFLQISLLLPLNNLFNVSSIPVVVSAASVVVFFIIIVTNVELYRAVTVVVWLQLIQAMKKVITARILVYNIKESRNK